MLIAELENTDNWKPDYAALSRKTGIPSYCIEPRYRRLRNLDAIIPSIKLKVTKEALDYQTALRDRKIKHKKNGKKGGNKNETN